MKTFQYIKYFFYIAFNWSFRLAWFTTKNEIRGERYYEINTTGVDNLKRYMVEPAEREHAENYQGTGYFQLEKVLDFLAQCQLDKSSPMIDFGSGKGRVLCVAAHYGFRNIRGIEMVKELCKIAEDNLENVRKKYPNTDFQVINKNASDYIIPADAAIFFFFNPFDRVMMHKVVRNIKHSLADHPRKVYVAYVNPMHKDLFIKAGFKQVFYLRKMEFVEASILSN
jgi:hypothetical protein